MYNVVRGDAGAAAGAAYCIRYFNAIYIGSVVWIANN